MSAPFDDVTDSEEENCVEEEISSVDDRDQDEYEEGFEKWRKRDDVFVEDSSDDEDRVTGMRSAKEKMADMIEVLCSTIDLAIGDSNTWGVCADDAEKLFQLIGKYYSKFGRVPKIFIQALGSFVDELEGENSVNENEGDAVDATESASNSESGSEEEAITPTAGRKLRKSDFSDKLAWAAYQRFTKTVMKMKELYADAAADQSGDEGEEAEEEVTVEMRDWDDAKMLEVLNIPVSGTEKRRKICRQIYALARSKQYRDVAVSAACHLAIAIIREERTPIDTMTNIALNNSIKTLQKAFIHAEEENVYIDKKVDVRNDQGEIKKHHLAPSRFYNIVLALLDEVKAIASHAAENPLAQYNIVRLENNILSFLSKVLKYYISKNVKAGVQQCAITLFHHLCQRRADAHESLCKVAATSYVGVVTTDLHATIKKLHSLVEHCKPDHKTRVAMTLSQAYHLALNDEFYGARDLMLRTRVSDEVASLAVDQRIVFNRVIAQMSLAAFRRSQFTDSAALLAELMTTERAMKELIGQKDLSYLVNRTGEDYSIQKEREDRRRRVMPHQYIPVELLDTIHLVLTMLSETVAEVKAPHQRGTRPVAYFHLMKRHGNMPMQGPPANDQDSIYTSHVALTRGDCAQAVRLLSSLQAWDNLWNRDEVVDNLMVQVKLDALKIFLIKFGSSFKSLTVGHLAEKFMLPLEAIRAHVSRLLLEDTVVGHWDHDTTCLIIERGTQSRLHYLAVECADRTSSISLFNSESGVPTTRGDRGRGRGRGRGRR